MQEGTTVVITAMDATANTVPKEFDVKVSMFNSIQEFFVHFFFFL